MTRRILLIEYLHLHSQWFADASPSMKAEGRAMLLAMAADLATLTSVSVSVAVCNEAGSQLPSMPNVDIICVDKFDEASGVTSLLQHGPFSDVLPIAPETGGILANLVGEFRSHGIHVIAASETTIQLGTDKWQLFQFLQQHLIPTIPTKRIADHTAAHDAETYVIKPADGAGCDGVQRMCHDESIAYRTQESPDSNVIVQPYIAGRSYSVGLIGQGANTPPVMLPVASQQVEWIDNRPHYRGGSVPASLSPNSRAGLRDLLNQLLESVTVDSGYLGIDLLKPDHLSDTEWLVTEINPRLCTSYIGYRQATTANLAGYLLGNRLDQPLAWKADSVAFICE